MIENVEGQWGLSGQPLIDLSPEFLVDCDGTHDDIHADCSVFGGWPYLAYQFLIAAGGVPSEQAYPYCAGTGDCYPCMQGPVSLCGPPPYTCDRNRTLMCANTAFTAKISSWFDVSEDEEEIKASLYANGPLSVLLDATELQWYDGGVWDGYVSGTPGLMGCSKVIHTFNMCHVIF